MHPERLMGKIGKGSIPMAENYNPKEIESKWQEKWDKYNPFKAHNPNEPGFDPKKPKFYVLDMFPYPSGSGLHVGHASGYIGTDIVARKKRMEGYNVLHPMGWDAFGLPAEQYAIQNNQHPRSTTDLNTANFRKQLKLIGLSYDWSREVDTSNPSYYRWTQWIFLQLYKKGLIYRKEMMVWWCEELKTVLANEEVINGKSERGNHPCVRKPLNQWVFKITEYAERLLQDLRMVDWPENVKKMQEEWIGKSLGAEVQFQVENSPEQITVFTTRPDTLFGVTALVLAPEHPLVKGLTTQEQKSAVETYVAKTLSRSDRERKSDVDDLSAEFLGTYCEHPLDSKKKLPIYIASYVLADYGTGSVMAVPAHDERDFKFAQRYKVDIEVVVVPKLGQSINQMTCFTEEGFLINSGEFNGLSSSDARDQITQKLASLSKGRQRVSYKIRDWIFSRQRYWGEPIPLYLTESDEVLVAHETELPVELPMMEDFKPSSDGSAPLARVKNWVEVGEGAAKKFRVTDTMPGWAGSCWYYLRFMDPWNTVKAFDQEAEKYWGQVDLYVGGASHAVMHLLYARFWHKILYDLGIVSHSEPFKRLFNQGMVTAYAYRDNSGRIVDIEDVDSQGQSYVRRSNGEVVEKFVTKMAKSLRNVINPDDVIREKGCDVFRLYSMFMGPLADDKPWSSESISGCEKFVKRFWNFLSLQILADVKTENPTCWRPLHKALKRIEDAFQNLNFNTCVAALMEGLNDLEEIKGSLSRPQLEMLVKMSFPFMPHLASEIWERLGHKDWIDHSPWPKLDPEKLVSSDYEMVIQINGKLRARKTVSVGISKLEMESLAEAEVRELLLGKKVLRTIAVPNKLVNFVIE